MAISHRGGGVVFVSASILGTTDIRPIVTYFLRLELYGLTVFLFAGGGSPGVP